MKKAFTMLELVVVIVVIGIIAAAALPRINDDHIAEAADQVMSHILPMLGGLKRDGV